VDLAGTILPLVGRQWELTELKQLLRSTCRSNGGTVFLIGEEGAGKTRLANELSAWAAASGMCVFYGRSTAFGPVVPLRPIIEILLQALRSAEYPEWEMPRPQRELVERLAGGEQPASPVLLAEAVLRLASAAGRSCGCLVVLDDLHHADEWTLSVVEYLADNLRQQPATLLATLSPAPSAGWELANVMARRGSATHLAVRRLDRPDVARLLASQLGVPAEDVPEPALNRIWQLSDGNPFVVRELISGLPRDGDGLPRTLVEAVAGRVARIGAAAQPLFCAAAVLGPRFSLPVARRVAGLDDAEARAVLRAGITAGLVRADQPEPDWYRFVSPLTVEALLGWLTPADRADLARQVGDVVVRLYPRLPGDWCPLVANLLTAAGDHAGAARTYLRTGTSALAAGSVAVAVKALDHAWQLCSAVFDVELHADVLQPLIVALTEAGRIDRAAGLAGAVEAAGRDGLATHRLADLHLALATAAQVAGRWSDGLTWVSAVRAMAGATPDARVDVVELGLLAGEQAGLVERVRRAALDAEATNLPDVACRAWDLLGSLLCRVGSPEAVACFERVDTLARENRLLLWSVRAQAGLGVADWLANGTTARLELAAHKADQLGARAVWYPVQAVLALHAVLSGRFGVAEELVTRYLPETIALGLTECARQLLVVRTVLSGHQAQRAAMERAVADLAPYGGPGPLALGLGLSVCALLEEDRDAAIRQLAGAATAEGTGVTLGGGLGLRLLLEVLAGRADWPSYRTACEQPAGQLRWNEQFLLLAKGVLLGRGARRAAAQAAVEEAGQAGEQYPVARHLGLRLVAEEAMTAGWGDPVYWLRLAEDYFHAAAVPAVAGACRAILRRAGAVVPRRRSDGEQIPRSLRLAGVTAREFEVLVLLAERAGNRVIASRLHISPRTVEKHVASLLAKLELPDRWALSSRAEGMGASRWGAG
jgi:DNA-binding CsgD family transcriptional regulator